MTAQGAPGTAPSSSSVPLPCHSPSGRLLPACPAATTQAMPKKPRVRFPLTPFVIKQAPPPKQPPAITKCAANRFTTAFVRSNKPDKMDLSWKYIAYFIAGIKDPGLESVGYSPYGAWPVLGTSAWLFLAQQCQQNKEFCFNVAVTCLPGGNPKGTEPQLRLEAMLTGRRITQPTAE